MNTGVAIGMKPAGYSYGLKPCRLMENHEPQPANRSAWGPKPFADWLIGFSGWILAETIDGDNHKTPCAKCYDGYEPEKWPHP